MNSHLVITGLMGVGKSTTADATASALSREHRDSDRDIELLFGRTGGELAADFGIDELHRIESGVLLGALASADPLVISAAGWVVEDPLCIEAMAKRSVVVVLDASVDEIVARSRTGDHRRPIPLADAAAIAERRAPMFDRAADLRLDATKPTNVLVSAIEQFIEQR